MAVGINQRMTTVGVYRYIVRERFCQGCDRKGGREVNTKWMV